MHILSRICFDHDAISESLKKHNSILRKPSCLRVKDPLPYPWFHGNDNEIQIKGYSRIWSVRIFSRRNLVTDLKFRILVLWLKNWLNFRIDFTFGFSWNDISFRFSNGNTFLISISRILNTIQYVFYLHLNNRFIILGIPSFEELTNQGISGVLYKVFKFNSQN